MSKIPSPPDLSAQTPKKLRLRGEDDRLHETLCVWFWTRLERIATLLHYRDDDWIRQHASSALERYENELQTLLQLIEKRKTPEHLSSLTVEYYQSLFANDILCTRLATHIRNHHRKSGPSKTLPTQIRAKLEQRKFQAPLEEVKGSAFNERRVHVGFVDILFSVSYASFLSITEPRLTGHALTPPTAVDKLVKFTDWQIHREPCTYAVDVISTLPPIRELVQRLKTIKDLGDFRTEVVLFTSSVSEEIKDILEHEGFIVWTKDELAKYLRE